MLALIADRSGVCDPAMREALIQNLAGDVIEGHAGLELSPAAQNMIRDRLSRYSVFTDDELMLKRWRRINVS